MKFYLLFSLIVINVAICLTFDWKDKIQRLFQNLNRDGESKDVNNQDARRFAADFKDHNQSPRFRSYEGVWKDLVEANEKAELVARLKKETGQKDTSYQRDEIEQYPERYHIDAAMNLRRNFISSEGLIPQRRQSKAKTLTDPDSDDDGKDDITTEEESETSSESELSNWKDAWREKYLLKKLDALNTSTPAGDIVNMVAARPWGVFCGDPKRQDVPTGTCVMAEECEPDLRIYRGDYFCGRTTFICCSIMPDNYDTVIPVDASMYKTSMETSSDEKNKKKKSSKAVERKKRRIDKRKKRRMKRRRKVQIRKKIQRIVKNINSLLKRKLRNDTTNRNARARKLKSFVKKMKSRYKQDVRMIGNVHELELIRMDQGMMSKLEQIKGLSEHFVNNQTFRDIMNNKEISKKDLRQLAKINPELKVYLDPTAGQNAVPQFEVNRMNYELDSEIE